MAFVKNCNTYAALLYPNEGKQEGRINLYCDDNYKLYLLFRDPGTGPLPNNSYNPNSKTGIGYQYLDNYHNYIDLLRNEKPIRVTFVDNANPARFVVYASREPVGEEEM